MERNLNNIVKLLEKKRKTTLMVAEVEDFSEELKEECRVEADVILSTIWLMTKDEYFRKIWDIYMGGSNQ